MYVCVRIQCVCVFLDAYFGSLRNIDSSATRIRFGMFVYGPGHSSDCVNVYAKGVRSSSRRTKQNCVVSNIPIMTNSYGRCND